MANKSGGKPSDRRAGKRRDRNQRVGIRVPAVSYTHLADSISSYRDYNNQVIAYETMKKLHKKERKPDDTDA